MYLNVFTLCACIFSKWHPRTPFFHFLNGFLPTSSLYLPLILSLFILLFILALACKEYQMLSPCQHLLYRIISFLSCLGVVLYLQNILLPSLLNSTLPSLHVSLLFQSWTHKHVALLMALFKYTFFGTNIKYNTSRR